jgi:hypothetical protein
MLLVTAQLANISTTAHEIEQIAGRMQLTTLGFEKIKGSEKSFEKTYAYNMDVFKRQLSRLQDSLNQLNRIAKEFEEEVKNY